MQLTKVWKFAPSVILGIAVMAGCSSSPDSGGVTGGEFTRAKFYASEGALRADSEAIVVARVQAQTVADDITPGLDFTISDVEVSQVKKGKGLGLKPGQVVKVRETGKSGDGGGWKYLDAGESYLLYLVTSGLPGDKADQFYITGANVGSFVQVPGPGGPSKFKQLNPSTGDRLPGELSAAEVPSE
ncbi:hypothetical protein [Terrabacter sp. 2RAF25]|uniref:hypothetical protein n=1 Tax=Terrabacter sp. 2RAF25 TaxID=3232998 RepID=UPI003F9A3263